ncbi:MAG: inositol monophosphatase [Chloroflexi bacterium]|nr:MAG: inositol monophosphatase [Chloroflexota bacterium]
MTRLPAAPSGKSATDIAREAAAVAREIILPRFQAPDAGNPIERIAKSPGNYVTDTDLACERAVIGLLAGEYPGMRVLSEETSPVVEGWDKGWLWVIDPLDGTGNFSRGIPTFAFNIALCHDGRPVLGLTQHIVTGDEFVAEETRGLLVNGVPARVSKVAALNESLSGFGLGYDPVRAGSMLSMLSGLWPAVQMLQNIGSAALGLAYAASGRFDLYVHHCVFPWDIAAGIVQVREGSGEIVDRDGGEISIYSEGLIAGAAEPVRQLSDVVRSYPWR